MSPAALGEYQSVLEEAWADLFGFYYIADPKMVELGIMPNEEAYKPQYSAMSIANVLLNLAEFYQIFAISHQPQLSSKANAHFLVEKARRNLERKGAKKRGARE